MASLRAEGIDTLVPVLVRVARVTTAPRIKPTHAATRAATAAGAAR